MLTQLELLGATGGLMDDGDGISVSPLDGLTEYPIEQTEFEYFETGFPNDPYYDVANTHDLSPPLTNHSSSPPILGSDGFEPHQVSYDQSVDPVFPSGDYSSAIALYDHDDSRSFDDGCKAFADLKSPDVDMKHFEDVKPVLDDLHFDDDGATYDAFSDSMKDDASSYGTFADMIKEEPLGTCDAAAITLDPLHHIGLDAFIDDKPELRTWEEGSARGKIGPLQRRALDAIFNVTDKPSRGLVSHIAAELGLHHITVKNFFSNGRRRLRRAAARLNDPERTKRENERRKEKRRMAAMASQASSEGSAGGAVAKVAPRTPPAESPPLKDPPVLSPQRRALMEKLADKVQRSVAQRSLAADLDLRNTPAPQTPNDNFLAQSVQEMLSHPVNGVLSQTADILSQASNDILSQASTDILSQASNDILSQASNDILSQTTSDILSQTTSDILSQASTDILSQASHDILAESTQELLASPHDFLGQTTHAMDTTSSLLQSPDPWNLF